VSARILPVDFDRDTGPHFQAARAGKLLYRHCKSCGQGVHIPTQFCGACGGADTEWRESPGRGTVYSWTTVMHQVNPAYPIPYTIVVIALDDAPGVRLIGSLAGDVVLKVGQPMQAFFDETSSNTGLPQWRPL
jgi:hypothetical protein